MLPCVCSVIDHRWRQNVVSIFNLGRLLVLNLDSLVMDRDSWFFTRSVPGLTITIFIKITVIHLFQQLSDMKTKEKSQVERLSVLPLPLIEQDLTRVIPCYQHGLLQSKLRERKVMNNTHESKDNFLNQVFTAKDELEKNHNWTFIGLASFEDNLDLKLAQHWIQLEQETFESVNITPLPPSFRPHMPYLSCKTDNTSRPLCVVRGKWSLFVPYQVSEKLLDSKTCTLGFSNSYDNWPKSTLNRQRRAGQSQITLTLCGRLKRWK